MPRPSKSGRSGTALIVLLVALVAAAAALWIQARRSGLGVVDLVGGAPPSAAAGDPPLPDGWDDARATRRGDRIDFLERRDVGDRFTVEERPLIAHVAVHDLDRDGLADLVVADAARNRVSWLRQAPRGRFTERVGAEVAGPAHVSPVDLDADGDVDVVVASLGVIFPNNAKIGAVIVLENDGAMGFTRRVIADRLARVSDVRAGDLDGDGDLDLAVAQFGYDEGETRWMENLGGWRFESHPLQALSGPINAEIADLDRDGDLDIVSLVSQEWEEIYAFVNDGRGRFTPTRIFGASNEDFGSSWISLADLDRDGDPDVIYSNGDAFDYAPPRGRAWNGVQWLENLGGLRFRYRRITDFAGACSPQAADLDGDGDLDIVVASAYNDWDSPDALSLAWLEHDGRLGFTLRPIAGSPTHLVTVAAGDVDGDGRPDLVTGGLHVSRPFDRMSRVSLWTNRWPSASR